MTADIEREIRERDAEATSYEGASDRRALLCLMDEARAETRALKLRVAELDAALTDLASPEFMRKYEAQRKHAEAMAAKLEDLSSVFNGRNFTDRYGDGPAIDRILSAYRA